MPFAVGRSLIILQITKINMASQPSSEASPPYKYAGLDAGQIRLLRILGEAENEPNGKPLYDIVHINLAQWNKRFETLSYTWGDPARVSTIQIGSGGHIGLTANLSQALPHLARLSETKYLWIDQLCINQNDIAEKGVQVGMMDKIYKAGKRALIWLGLADNHSRLVQQWFGALADYFDRGTLTTVRPDAPEFQPDVRDLFIRNSFAHPETDRAYAPAIHHFLHRPWFTRGWIVQELLLSDAVTFVVGGEDAASSFELSLQDFRDLVAVPTDLMPEHLKDGTETCYHRLLNIKLHHPVQTGHSEQTGPPADPVPQAPALAFLRLMAQVSADFATTELRDRAFAFAGLADFGASFAPDYSCSVAHAFARFALALARAHGSVDFLSLCSSWQDDVMASTPAQLRGLPTWVPSWTSLPLAAPLRLVAGGSRALRHDVVWDAAGGRAHRPSPEGDGDAVATGRFCVRGRVVDRVGAVAGGAVFDKYWEDATDAYLDGLASTIEAELGGERGWARLADWTRVELVGFLNAVCWNGRAPEKTAEVLLRREPVRLQQGSEEARWELPDQGLGLSLCMGRGRRFMRSDGGRLGLVPRLGTEVSLGGKGGSVIVIVHGCRVPVILQPVEGEDSVYKLVGDCFVEGIMFGEAVTWAEDDADTFVLV